METTSYKREYNDYFGNIIAGNLKVYQLHIIPEQVENFNYLLSRLKDILKLSIKELKRLKIKKTIKTLGKFNYFRKFKLGSIFKNK